MNLTEEQVIELFEQFLDENYYVGELTEENVLWVYEEEFLPALEQHIEESAGCNCENCECENCQCENVQEEQQISPKMQAYLNEMSKNGVRKMNMDSVGNEDEDVNNDGMVNDDDKYLLQRRLKISKAKLADEDTSKSEKAKLIRQIEKLEGILNNKNESSKKK